MKNHRMSDHQTGRVSCLGELFTSQQERANTQRRSFLAFVTGIAAGLLAP